MSDVENSDLAAIAEDVYAIAGRFIEEGQPPFAVAAVFTMIALQIYKTSMTEEDYHAMVDTISENRNHIKSLPEMLSTVGSSAKIH